MIIFAMLVSFVVGILGEVLNHDYSLNLPGLGSILSIVVMGAFILNSHKK